MAIIKIRVCLVNIMMDIAPDICGTCVIIYHKVLEKLIAQCQNAIYSKITTSLIYYKKFRRILEDEGYEFKLNDPCVSNKIIKGSQMNVCFHVYDCKLSQKSPKVVGKTITWIKQ